MYSLFERLINPFPPQAPATPPTQLYAFFKHYVKGSTWIFILMALATGCVAAMEVSLFAFLGSIVDKLNAHTPETFWASEKYTLIGIGVLLLIVLPLGVFLQSTIMHQGILGNFPMRIRWLAHRYLLGQSYQFFQDEFSGRIATKIMQTALALRETIMRMVDVLLYMLVYFSGILVLAASLDWRLLIPLVTWFIVYCGLLRYFLPRLSKVAKAQADARSDMTGRIVDTYTNIATVKLFSHSQREEQYAKEGMTHFVHTVYPQMRLATSLSSLVWLLNAVLIFSIAAMSIWLWSNLAITTGAIAAAIALVLRLNGMAQTIMWDVSSIFENIGTVQDGLNTIAAPRLVQDAKDATELQLKSPTIEFKNVLFNYGKQEKTLLKDFNLTIKAGEKVGLVGRSGAGKSTLVNLILRFYDIQSGSISIDGQDIKQVTQESLRKHIGMVTQDTALLHRSVSDNLLYGRPDATEDEMIAAAKQAEAHDFILELEDSEGRKGYDAHVGERGIKLSGGQRQRIAIARVLLKNAPILFLDEATSALDSEVETAIQSNFDTLMQNKTVIAIAHRLSTIAAMDRLIVMDKGKIIEQGSHHELLAAKGAYAQLWSHQSGGFLPELPLEEETPQDSSKPQA